MAAVATVHSSSAGGQEFASRARAVAAAWPGSARERAWRTGYLPLQDPTVLPPGAFHNQTDKAAFYAGHYTVTVPLPTAPGTGTVHWGNGTRLALPVLPPMQALALAGGGGSANPPSIGKLTITAAAPSTLRVATNRGFATVPAWTFRLAEYPGAFTVAAVRPSIDAPTEPTDPDVSADGSAGLSAVSADGRTLTLMVEAPSCGAPTSGSMGADVYETADAVVVGGRTATRAPADGMACAAALSFGPVTVRLARPLGDRTVLSVVDGAPESLPVPPPAPR